jgi:hypothetical protein
MTITLSLLNPRFFTLINTNCLYTAILPTTNITEALKCTTTRNLLKAIVPLWPFSFIMIRLSIVILGFSIISCTQTDLKEPLEYTGPLREVENVELYNSENEQIKSKLTAEVFYEFANGDREFPKGVYIEMYNEFGNFDGDFDDQEHFIGPVAYGKFENGFGYNVGVVFGVTEAAPDAMIKTVFEYKKAF